MRESPYTASFSAWIDAFRWLAALSVLITHAGSRMMVPISQKPHPSKLDFFYSFIAGFDHYAVMVFFVLSGLLVGGSVVQDIRRNGTFRFVPYIGKRLIRLNIVLWPAYGFGGICVILAVALGAARFGVLDVADQSSLSVSALACNMVFLQDALCPQSGANRALWSLYNEFWYYAIFPAFVIVWLGTVALSARVLVAVLGLTALAALTLLQFTGSAIGPYMLIWLMGVFASVAERPFIRSVPISSSLFVCFCCLVRLAIHHDFEDANPLGYVVVDFITSMLFASMLISMKHFEGLRNPPWPKLHTTLARFSFSLYAIHVPIMTLYVTLLMTTTGMGWHESVTTPIIWMAIVGALTLSFGVAWLFSRVTELQTHRLRRLLLSRYDIGG